MIRSSKSQSFDELVDCWVYGVVTRGVTTFNSLLASLPGVYPSVALESLKRLTAAGKFSNHQFPLTLVEPEGCSSIFEQPSEPCHQITLPIPHPLDYDWRFGDSAVTYLLNKCLALTNPDETVALLGVPSVLRSVLESSYERSVVLLDSNPSVINQLLTQVPDAGVVLCDVVRDPLPQLEASVVIVDPPWYEEYLMGFMWAAVQLCRRGGHVLVSVPPIGTRPGIDRDREKMFEWTRQLGLSLIKLEAAILPYISPSFEINALKAEGFHAILEKWRRGDLAMFKKERREMPPRPTVFPGTEVRWPEETLNEVRIRVRPCENFEFDDPTLITIIDGNILPSASRRDTRRALVDVWTSGNRVFACHGRNVLKYILRALAMGYHPEELVTHALGRGLTVSERALVARAVSQLTEIVDIERSENSLFEESFIDA